MEEIPLLREITVVVGIAVFVSVVVARLRLPTVAGLLLSGALVGPHGLGLVSDTHAIEVIAEMGVVLLLFTIGLEFSLERLKHIMQRVALGGLLQVGGTLGLVVVVCLSLGVAHGPAVFYGFVFALSSTAIVLRSLSERREVDAPHGRFIVGALIFQDLCVVPMVLIVPLLGASTEGATGSIAIALLKAAAVVVAVIAISRLIVPRVLKLVEASRSREVFLLAVLALCIGTAWITSLAGLSLALGAFLGGLVVADTEYSHRAMGDMLPLRDVFVSFFFVSLGMFFNGEVLAEHPVFVLVCLLGFVMGKGTLATVAALIMRFPPRAAWLAGMGLAQFGEFGFVLVKLGTREGVVTQEAASPVLTAGIISMFLTPLLLQVAPHITAGERLLAPLARLLGARGIEEASETGHTLKDHVIVIGYGEAGRLVSESLRALERRHVILELNAENVRRGREFGDPVFYADATSEEALGHAHLSDARCVVLMINDLQATYRVVDAVRRVAPSVPVIARTHYLANQRRLLDLGASKVVIEEAEGGLEVLTQVLRALDVPRNVIDERLLLARSADHARRLTVPRNEWAKTAGVSGVKVESVLVLERSHGAFRSVREMDLRATTGALLVALQRGETLLSPLGADESVKPGDVAFLVGDPHAVERAVALLGTVPTDQQAAAPA